MENRPNWRDGESLFLGEQLNDKLLYIDSNLMNWWSSTS